MAKQTPAPGDSVEWKSSQGTIRGTVKKTLTAPTDIKGHHVAASKDNPELLVQSAKTGALAAHKPDSVKKVSAKAAPAKKAAAKKAPAKKAATKKTSKKA